MLSTKARLPGGGGLDTQTSSAGCRVPLVHTRPSEIFTTSRTTPNSLAKHAAARSCNWRSTLICLAKSKVSHQIDSLWSLQALRLRFMSIESLTMQPTFDL